MAVENVEIYESVDSERERMLTEQGLLRYGPEYRAYFESLKPAQQTVLIDNKIFTDDGNPLITTYQNGTEDVEKFDFKPKIALPAIKRLMALDRTATKRWTAWIFFQAGGGHKGMDESKSTLTIVKHNIRDKLISSGMSGAQADVIIARDNDKFLTYTYYTDEDVLTTYQGLFGWSWDFPGFRHPADSSGLGRYEAVSKAMTRANAIFKRLNAVNKVMLAMGRDTVSDDSAAYVTVAAVNDMCLRVERAETAYVMRQDVRIGKWEQGASAALPPERRKNTVYADSNLSLVVPLTYAAARQYGVDKWSFANAAKFDEVVSGDVSDDPKTNPWLLVVRGRKREFGVDETKPSVVGIVRFRAPVPAWYGTRGMAPEMYTLTNLALLCPVGESEVNDIAVYTEHGHTATKSDVALNVQTVLRMIRSEVGRAQRVQMPDQFEQFDIFAQIVTQIGEAETEITPAKAQEIAAEVVTVSLAKMRSAKSSAAMFSGDVRLNAEYTVQSALQAAVAAAKAQQPTGLLSEPVLVAIRAELVNAQKEAEATLRGMERMDRGADVYTTAEEAESVATSFMNAVDAFVQWIASNAHRFDELYAVKPRPAAKAAADEVD